MLMNATRPQGNEHTICYAYPSSPLACKLKRGMTGCYVVQTVGAELPFEGYDSAKGHADSLGTTPQRWSMDHPLNAAFRARQA